MRIAWNKGLHYHTKAIKRYCLICKKEFYIKPSQLTRKDIRKRGGKYCNRKCLSIAIKEKTKGKNNYFYGKKYYGILNGNYKGGKIKKYCIICDKIFYTIPARINKKYCSFKCRGLGEKGELNIAWQGGKSFEEYPKIFNEFLKDKIRERDNLKCRLCGVPQIECIKKLNIHHIDYNKKNCNINNLISLCVSCHAKTIKDRIYWMNYLNNIIQTDLKGII